MFLSSQFNVHDAYGAGRRHSLRHAGTIRFDRSLDGEVQEDTLFFGPYVWLPAGRYSFAFDGELDGELALAFTAEVGERKIARVSLTSFDQPVVVDLSSAANKFEIVASRTPSLESMVLRYVLVDYRAFPPGLAPEPPSEGEPEHGPERRVPAPAGAARVAARSTPPPGAGGEADRPAPIAIRDDEGRERSLPLVWPARSMRVHDAYGEGEANRLWAGSSIVFDAKSHGAVEEEALFFGPYFHFEPGEYSFRFRGVLEGSLGLRFTKNFGAETLLEVEVASFDAPVRVKIESPADKVEIIGRRLESTQAMRLSAIEIAAAPADENRTGDGAKTRHVPIYARLFGSRAARAGEKGNPLSHSLRPDE